MTATCRSHECNVSCHRHRDIANSSLTVRNALRGGGGTPQNRRGIHISSVVDENGQSRDRYLEDSLSLSLSVFDQGGKNGNGKTQGRIADLRIISAETALLVVPLDVFVTDVISDY